MSLKVRILGGPNGNASKIELTLDKTVALTSCLVPELLRQLGENLFEGFVLYQTNIVDKRVKATVPLDTTQSLSAIGAKSGEVFLLKAADAVKRSSSKPASATHTPREHRDGGAGGENASTHKASSQQGLSEAASVSATSEKAKPEKKTERSRADKPAEKPTAPAVSSTEAAAAAPPPKRSKVAQPATATKISPAHKLAVSKVLTQLTTKRIQGQFYSVWLHVYLTNTRQKQKAQTEAIKLEHTESTAQLQADVARLFSENRALSEENEVSRQKTDELSKALEQAHAMISSLESELLESTQKAAKCVPLEAELKSTQAALKKSQDEAADLRESIRTQRDLAAMRRLMNERDEYIAKQQKELCALRTTAKALQQAVDDAVAKGNGEDEPTPPRRCSVAASPQTPTPAATSTPWKITTGSNIGSENRRKEQQPFCSAPSCSRHAPVQQRQHNVFRPSEELV
eukprot:PhM_4_TR8425/c0_g1_i1/m.9074